MYHLPTTRLIESYQPFIVFDNLFSFEECNEIKELGYNLQVNDSMIASHKTNDSIRKSSNSWIPHSKEIDWLFRKVSKNILECNLKWYGFDIVGFEEMFQFTEYKEGDFYTWHSDLGNDYMSKRKLSVVIQLTNPDEYEGGDLQFFSARNQKLPKKLGDMIVFPSFEQHRVTPIKSGVRNSLVLWVSGPFFR